MESWIESQKGLLDKARTAGPLSVNLKEELDSFQSPLHSNKTTAKQSWREAASSVNLVPRSVPYPNIHEFEQLVLPSLRTLQSQFVCKICPHCQRPVIDSVMKIHLDACYQRKQASKAKATQNIEDKLSDIKRKRKDDLSSSTGGPESHVPPAKKIKLSAKQKDPSTTTTKTRQTKQARQPKQPKPAKEKPQVTYSPDRNCGVLMPNGQPCMRSLTCKQHPMGAKRSVMGRSAPYDVLLSNYHRQHQLKQAQLSASAAQAAQLESDQQQEQQAQQNPEREVAQVFEGVGRVVYSPLATNDTMTSTPLRSQQFRLREMLSMALLPRRLPPTGNLLYGRSIGFLYDNPSHQAFMRSQASQQATYLAQLQQKQQMLRRQQAAKLAEGGGASASVGTGLNTNSMGTPNAASLRLQAQQKLQMQQKLMAQKLQAQKLQTENQK